MEQTPGGERAQPHPGSEPPSQPFPSAPWQTSWASRQGRKGVCREGCLEIPEPLLERQQVNGLESERQRQAPGFYLGAWAAWPRTPCPPPSGTAHRRAHFCSTQSSSLLLDKVHVSGSAAPPLESAPLFRCHVPRRGRSLPH